MNQDIDKLRKELPRGYTTILSVRFQISKQSVSYHINSGNIESEEFKAALDMRDDHQREIQRRQKQLAKQS